MIAVTILLVSFSIFPNVYAQEKIFEDVPIKLSGILPLITDDGRIFNGYDISEKLDTIEPYMEDTYVFYDPMNFESFLRTYSLENEKKIHVI